MRRTLSCKLSPFVDQRVDVITKIPDLLRPLRAPAFWMKNIPREFVQPADIRALSIKDVVLVVTISKVALRA